MAEEGPRLQTRNIKPKTARIVFTVRLDDELNVMLVAYMAETGIGKSKAIRALLAKGLSNVTSN